VKIHVSFDIEIPDATDDQIEAWFAYSLGLTAEGYETSGGLLPMWFNGSDRIEAAKWGRVEAVAQKELLQSSGKSV
jgi:hypothetical protein